MNVVIASQPLQITRKSMNRGHLYLEIWYWMLDLIEREKDDERRSSMNTVQIAFAEGVDTDASNQYRAGCKALEFAKQLGESVFASNIETLLADRMYIDVQDNPASVAHKLDTDPNAEARETEGIIARFGSQEPTLNLEMGAFSHEDWNSENDIANECRGGV